MYLLYNNNNYDKYKSIEKYFLSVLSILSFVHEEEVKRVIANI